VPYIPREDRKKFQYEIAALGNQIKSEGELNFVITSLCHLFLSRLALSYASLNTVTGVLESVKLEFFRRVVTPYEDSKIAVNGDL